jgi:hypothetical protein
LGFLIHLLSFFGEFHGFFACAFEVGFEVDEYNGRRDFWQ